MKKNLKMKAVETKAKLKNYNEINSYMENAFKAFQEDELSKATTKEELEALEQSVVGKMTDYDKQIAEAKYELPETTTLDGVDYTREEVISMIINLVSEQESEYKYTRGVYEVCRDWKGAESVSYRLLDATLNMIYNLRYKGKENYLAATVISYFINPETMVYFEDSAQFILLSNMHNAILEKLDNITAITQINESPKPSCSDCENINENYEGDMGECCCESEACCCESGACEDDCKCNCD